MGRTDRLRSPAELAEDFTRRVQDELHNLNGVALIQAWKQVLEVAKRDSERPDENAQADDILDVVAGTELPDDRKVELLQAEWNRLMKRLGEVANAVEAITGTQKELDERRQQT